ncbi:MAG: helix-turn-helix domain-containing protein [Nibricoccus sp.]
MKTTRVRREGFKGQRLLVVPAPIREGASRHPLLRTLLVTDAGFFPHAIGHRVERPQGAATHLVIACLHGRGWIRAASRTQPVGAGDLVWLRANEPHAYGSDREDPWTISWAHFRGDECTHWRKLLGWASDEETEIGHVAPHQLAELKLEHVYAALELGYALPQLLSAAIALRSFFCAAMQLTSANRPTPSTAERINAVQEKLRESCALPFRLEEIAAAANLSVPHFSELFRRQTGYAPIDYLIRQRIQRACLLLDTTEHPIGDIATQVGYNDPYYFTRSFRRVMGCSPRAYRSTVKG